MSEKTELGVAATAREADAKPLPSKITQVGDQARQAGAQAAAHASELADDASKRGASLAGDVKDHLASAAERRKATERRFSRDRKTSRKGFIAIRRRGHSKRRSEDRCPGGCKRFDQLLAEHLIT